MDVLVNGKTASCPEGATLHDLLGQFDLKPETVVVERNRELVPREQFAKTRLEAGDTLEVLQFVGGG